MSPNALHDSILAAERERELRVVLETIAGERCPCGHLVDDHRPSRSNGGLPAGLTLVVGACRVCECRGLIEPDELDDDDEVDT